MSAPITAVGPLKVSTKPILTDCCAVAGAAKKAKSTPMPSNDLISVPPHGSVCAAVWHIGRGSLSRYHGCDGPDRHTSTILHCGVAGQRLQAETGTMMN